uniref:HAUS augmin like complex subunit 2 n=1 Tax=Seriola dumerili TaxID=41447 RepID=A0A3B4V4Q7_SERDU
MSRIYSLSLCFSLCSLSLFSFSLSVFQMHQWDVSLFSVTPAAALLSRCVSRGAVSQVSKISSHVSCRLLQVQLEVELLKEEKKSADVTHTFHLTRRFHMLQMFCGHLQELLKDQNSLRQRLMRPLGRTNLPVQAHLHRSVVEVVKMLLDFIETLEEKLDSVHSCTTTRDRLTQLNTSLAQLLAQVAEVQSLSNQVLQWKEVVSSLQSDTSA